MFQGVRRRLRKRSIIWDAIRLSTLLVIIFILAFIIAGSQLASESTPQLIVYALLGALLQAAFLGIIYEVWLRADVEDATLEKLGTSRDVRSHGLIRLDAEANVDWPSLLDGAKQLIVVTARPEQMLGQFDDLIIRSAGSGSLDDFRIAVPQRHWTDAIDWLEAYKERWSGWASGATFFAIQLSEVLPYDLIATETRSILLLRRLVGEPGVEAVKLLEFRRRDELGIGAWLSRQREAILKMSPQLGYSPPGKTDLPHITPAPEQPASAERLT